MGRILRLLREMARDAGLIWSLAINDFKAKFAGSLLGVVWAFLNQIVTLAMFYVVFSLGFRAAPVESFPYFLWLSCGMVPWFFFQEAWPRATDSLTEYGYLVKRTAFRVEYLPLIRILASFIVHLAFLVMLLLLFVCYGFFPNRYWLQLIYYVLCNFALLLSVSLLTSSVVVFYRDMSQFIAIFLSVLFWMTPLCWEPPRPLVVYNPISYIVCGFRDSMIFSTWFWEKPLESGVFWGLTLALACVGAFCFRRLRPHFAEVL